MKREGWLVKKDRFCGMRFFFDEHTDCYGTVFIRVHYASCKNKFLYGITSNVQLIKSERMKRKLATELWKSSLDADWYISPPLWRTN